MWRAYGGSSGVAIVINPDSIGKKESTVAAYITPTNYFDGAEFERFIDNQLDRCYASVDKFIKLGEELVAELMFRNFVFIVMTTKHPGFLEEKEWRIIANPALFMSKGLQQGVETIDGIPQNILKLPLEGSSETNDESRTLDALISRIIIGPSEAALAIAEALMVELEQACVKNPQEKVWVSNIPYREVT